MNKYYIRQEQLLAELKSRNKMEIAEIADFLNVSFSTARRVSLDLVASGKAVRIYKGIQIINSFEEHSYSYVASSTENVEEKKRIGAYAATLVDSNDVLFLSAGTTLFYFAVELAKRIEAGQIKNVFCFTSSTIQAEILGQCTKVVLVSGEYRARRKDTAGFLTAQILQKVHFKKAFLGVDGIDIQTGLMATDLETAHMDHITSQRSDAVYILAAHDKFERNSLISFDKLSSQHTIITDKGVDPVYLDAIKSMGVECFAV